MHECLSRRTFRQTARHTGVIFPAVAPTRPHPHLAPANNQPRLLLVASRRFVQAVRDSL